MNVSGALNREQAAATILNGATTQFGDIQFSGLLLFESQIVNKANDALNDVQKFLATAGTSPTQAVKRLAQFAADIVTAFNQLMSLRTSPPSEESDKPSSQSLSSH
jgi:hypothetical protein